MLQKTAAIFQSVTLIKNDGSLVISSDFNLMQGNVENSKVIQSAYRHCTSIKLVLSDDQVVFVLLKIHLLSRQIILALRTVLA